MPAVHVCRIGLEGVIGFLGTQTENNRSSSLSHNSPGFEKLGQFCSNGPIGPVGGRASFSWISRMFREAGAEREHVTVEPREDCDVRVIRLLPAKPSCSRGGKAGTGGNCESLTAKREASVEDESSAKEHIVVVEANC